LAIFKKITHCKWNSSEINSCVHSEHWKFQED